MARMRQRYPMQQERAIHDASLTRPSGAARPDPEQDPTEARDLEGILS